MPKKATLKVERTLFDDLEGPETTNGHGGEEGADTTSTFSDNLALAVHRWFRYSAGFSAPWVRDVIEREKEKGRSRVLDPFAGSGTVALEAEACQVEGVGVEAHPFVVRIAQAKLNWRESPKTFKNYALSILEEAKKEKVERDDYPVLMGKCFPPETLNRLEALRCVWERRADDSPMSDLAWLALCAILRECSPVGTAQWQYVLPNKTKARAIDPFQAFESKVYLFSGDMVRRQGQAAGPKARVCADDARECRSVSDGWADLVITSPPYANNYDYADATRLEMTFFGEIEGWGCLQETVRTHLVRSCTQHVAPLMKQTNSIVQAAVLAPIARELQETCQKLAKEREGHGGKKPYHTMVAAYFKDMAEVWLALRRVTSKRALVCFVVGDSAPYGVHVPVERWLGELAVAAGFESFEFEKTRDRNIKWKNRKHRVPLHEGRLWVKG
jgi:16S rRNA G966 N2-methylase RsmD